MQNRAAAARLAVGTFLLGAAFLAVPQPAKADPGVLVNLNPPVVQAELFPAQDLVPRLPMQLVGHPPSSVGCEEVGEFQVCQNTAPFALFRCLGIDFQTVRTWVFLANGICVRVGAQNFAAAYGGYSRCC